MSPDWYIAGPVMLCWTCLFVAFTFWRAKRRKLAVAYCAAAAVHAFFGFEMHYGGRSWHDLILGPCSRTEYHRRPTP